MSTISIIGTGNMTTAIGGRAAAHGHTVEILGRNPSKAQAAAEAIGDSAIVGTYGARPAGDIVFLAVPDGKAVEVIEQYGDALAGRIVVDITNPFNADGTAVVTSPGKSIAQQIAVVLPEGAHVIKAFNTIFRPVLVEATPLDAFFAGDSPEARQRFAEFVATLDMRPLDTGGLDSTYVLEWAAILMMGLARNGAGWDVSLGANVR